MEAIPVQHEHCDALSNALARAFFNDPVTMHIFQDPDKRMRKTRWIFARWLRVFIARGSACTTPDLQGAALWQSPERDGSVGIIEELRAGLLSALFILHPGEQCRGLKMHLDALSRMRRLLDRPHWVLDTLGVDPEHHGKSIAKVIMSPVLSRADADQVPCFVITHKPGNVAFYEHMGFTLIHESPLRGAHHHVFSLRRHPAPPAST